METAAERARSAHPAWPIDVNQTGATARNCLCRWDSFSDCVACAWDATKCRVKESLGMSAVRSHFHGGFQLWVLSAAGHVGGDKSLSHSGRWAFRAMLCFSDCSHYAQPAACTLAVFLRNRLFHRNSLLRPEGHFHSCQSKSPCGACAPSQLPHTAPPPTPQHPAGGAGRSAEQVRTETHRKVRLDRSVYLIMRAG